MSSLNDSTAIGIDLGTTCCCVAYINKNGLVDVIPNSGGYRTTPSYVAFTKGGKLVGNIAKEEIFKNQKNVVYDSKRLIGRKFDDKYIQEDMKNWTFKVKESNNQPLIEVTVDDKSVCYKPEEISAILLENLKRTAEEYIGTSITDAVITVPAHFNYHQRTATAEAGKLAGLNVLRIINEPTAATLAYIHKNQIRDPKNILVFDLGGGTLDVSVVQVNSNNIKVVATSGNTHLGGRDCDNSLKNYICKKIVDKYGKKALKSEITARRIRATTERVKIRLSLVELAIIDLQCLYNGKDIELEVSRKEFEDINSDLFKSAIDIVVNCLADAKLKKTEIDDVVLVGGSTRIPKIQQILSDFFGGKLNKTIHPDEAVAYGAAIQAAKNIESNNTEIRPTVMDVTPLSLGIAVHGNLMSVLIPRNSTIPVTVTETFYTVCDKQTAQEYNIYEGERRFVADNIRLGKCKLAVPSKPPGYPMDLTFHVNEDGILQISASDPTTGLHTSLSIVYEKQDFQIVSDIINDATVNKSVDESKKNIAMNWRNLRNYCVKLKAICDYDNKNMDREDKATIKTTANDIYNWTENHPIRNGSKKEEKAVKKKVEEIRSVCEPLAMKYGYDVYALEWHKVCKFVTELNWK